MKSRRLAVESAISDERMPCASNGASQSGTAALVIVFGNPLREDDGVGWAVAEALRARGRVAVRAVHQLGPELAEVLSQASRAVFADARHGGRPGAVRSREISPASTRQELTHVLDPRTLLLYSQLVYGRAPRATLVSIAGARFGFGWRLSPAVRRALPVAVRTIEDLVGADGHEARAGQSSVEPFLR